MGKYNFDKTINRIPTCSYRWDVNEGELPLNIADMDFLVMPEIVEAVKDRSEQSCYGYTYVPDKYYESYIKWWGVRHDTRLEKEWFVFSKSVVASIDSIFKHLGKPGEQVVMFTPIYNVFFNCILNNKLLLKECEFIRNELSIDIDWDKLELLLKEEKTKFFILCNPHNPVGRKFDCEELNRIINLCKRNNVVLISDEIHADLDYNKDKYNSILKDGLDRYENIIMLVSPGKVFNVAGLHSSVAIIPHKELKDIVQDGFYKDDIGEPNYFAIEPVIAAFDNGLDYVEQLNVYLNENKAVLNEFLLKNLPNIKICGGDFTYLLWLDISVYSSDSRLFVTRLKEQTGLVLAPGINYGKSGEGFVRINIASTRKNIVDACNRLLAFICDIYKE